MLISKSTCFVFIIVVMIMTLSVTVFNSGKDSTTAQQNSQTNIPIYERTERYPVVDSEEIEPSDPAKRTKLQKQRQRYDKDAPFRNPGPKDIEVAFLPESQFDFPALPVTKSDVIVIGEVLNAEAHRSENKINVFSNFGVRVDQVLKGTSLSAGSVINLQRVGGVVRYANGKKVLFRLFGNGMPAIGKRYAFFLNVLDEDYGILTAYELGAEGILPLDDSQQFQRYQGESEVSFILALRTAIAQSVAQHE